MQSKTLLGILVALLIALFVLLGFLFYNNAKREGQQPQTQPEETSTAEEIVEPSDVKEPEEIPSVEGDDEEVQVMNEVTVNINNLKFYPQEVRISPGTKVIWINNDTSPHKVVAYDRVFYGERILHGERYEFTFTWIGVHRYFDAIWPKAGKGTIIVQEEPLPVTGAVIGIDLSQQETNSKFALVFLLSMIMVLGIAHGIFTHHKI